MSKKKKRHPQPAPGARSQGAVLADEQKRYEKRLNPKARNLLLTDLVVLALAAMGDQMGLLPPLISAGITILGFAMLLLALWYQFGGKSGTPGSRGPRI